MNFDAIVLGGGAAGLFCAFQAGQRGRQVLLIEHNAEPGRKILISGGGRCNFTNIHCRPECFLSENPHFAKSALARYSPQDFVSLVARHGIPFHEKKLGQLFCDRSARDITGLLLRECAAAAVRIETGCRVEDVRHSAPGFLVATSKGAFQAKALVVATGGLSIPRIGATDLGYRLARQFGLPIVPCRPALVPLTFATSDREAWCDLAGVALEAVASCGGARFEEKLLITHRGLSGPSILQVSSYWHRGAEIVLDLLPSTRLRDELIARRARGDTAELKTIAALHLPRRFVDRWFERKAASQPVARLSNAAVEAFLEALHSWRICPAGTEGYEKAEVTAGGVSTEALSSKTMEAKNVPGLFFIGEVVDVTGWLGGYNFQWAWSSAYAAAAAL